MPYCDKHKVEGIREGKRIRARDRRMKKAAQEGRIIKPRSSPTWGPLP